MKNKFEDLLNLNIHNVIIIELNFCMILTYGMHELDLLRRFMLPRNLLMVCIVALLSGGNLRLICISFACNISLPVQNISEGQSG